MRLVIAKVLITVGFVNLCSLHSAGHEIVKEESSTVTDTARKGHVDYKKFDDFHVLPQIYSPKYSHKP